MIRCFLFFNGNHLFCRVDLFARLFSRFFIFSEDRIGACVRRNSRGNDPNARRKRTNVNCDITIPFSNCRVGRKRGKVSNAYRLRERLNNVFNFLLCNFATSDLFFVHFFQGFRYERGAIMYFQVAICVNCRLTNRLFRAGEGVFRGFIRFCVFLTTCNGVNCRDYR